MIDLSSHRGAPVAVMGLGRSGLATARALLASGVEVWAWDDDVQHRKAAQGAGIAIVDLVDCDWPAVATVVWSPGIPHSFPKPHPVAAAARRAGRVLVCDIELLARAQPRARYVGITGTNGKSTTTALVGHILAAAGTRAAVGGNLGPPALTLPPLEEEGTYVLELSSYQLELLAEATFQVAALINISPDHLDRHGGMAGYVAAKRRIFRETGWQGDAVVGVDDAHCREIADGLARGGAAAVTRVTVGTRAGDVTVLDGILHDDSAAVVDLRSVATLPGSHNWQNAAMAYAIARRLDLAPGRIVKGIVTYPGLPHRQELVAELDGIRFINDSKATNAEAAAKALDCYDPIYWIAGGIAKEGGIESLRRWFPRIAEAFLVGDAARAFARTLQGQVRHHMVGDLATAIDMAHDAALRDGRPGAVVLLSPACASFDQWPNFEARGDAFRALVRARSHRSACQELVS